MKPDKAKIELREQMQGMLISLSIFVLTLVWAIDTATPIRYGVSGAILSLILVRLSFSISRRKKLNAMRAQQLKKHDLEALSE